MSSRKRQSGCRSAGLSSQREIGSYARAAVYLAFDHILPNEFQGAVPVVSYTSVILVSEVVGSIGEFGTRHPGTPHKGNDTVS